MAASRWGQVGQAHAGRKPFGDKHSPSYVCAFRYKISRWPQRMLWFKSSWEQGHRQAAALWLAQVEGLPLCVDTRPLPHK